VTEQEWLAANDPRPMLVFLRRRVSRRKARLFACACCHQVSGLLTEASRAALVVAERYADTSTRDEAVEAAADGARRALEAAHRSDQMPSGFLAAAAVTFCLDASRFRLAAFMVTGCRSPSEPQSDAKWGHEPVATLLARGRLNREAESRRVAEYHRQQALLLRDIIGNPFRPVTTDPSWLTSAVVSLARGIYTDRAFDRLPILADALQDAGCEDAEVLAHCRGPGPHVRGCWALDLVLGKG
jgi:hypothetical protein